MVHKGHIGNFIRISAPCLLSACTTPVAFAAGNADGKWLVSSSIPDNIMACILFAFFGACIYYMLSALYKGIRKSIKGEPKKMETAVHRQDPAVGGTSGKQQMGACDKAIRDYASQMLDACFGRRPGTASESDLELDQDSKPAQNIVGTSFAEREKYAKWVRRNDGTPKDVIYAGFFKWVSRREYSKLLMPNVKIGDLKRSIRKITYAFFKLDNVCRREGWIEKGLTEITDVKEIGELKVRIQYEPEEVDIDDKELDAAWRALEYYQQYLQGEPPGTGDSVQVKRDGPISEGIFFDFLNEHGIEYVDHRGNGGKKSGNLSIKGGLELYNFIRYCKLQFGVNFRYKAAGLLVFHRKPGWWTKDRVRPLD